MSSWKCKVDCDATEMWSGYVWTVQGVVNVMCSWECDDGCVYHVLYLKMVRYAAGKRLASKEVGSVDRVRKALEVLWL